MDLTSRTAVVMLKQERLGSWTSWKHTAFKQKYMKESMSVSTIQKYERYDEVFIITVMLMSNPTCLIFALYYFRLVQKPELSLEDLMQDNYSMRAIRKKRC